MTAKLENTLADRVQDRMDALGLNPFATAKRADLKTGYVHDIIRGKVKNPGAAKLRALAKALETSSAYLLGDKEIPVEIFDAEGGLVQPAMTPTAPLAWSPDGVTLLPIRHELAAMVWRNATEVSAQPLGYQAATIPSGLKGRDQWYELVRDDSMSAIVPKGSLVHVVDVSADEIAEIKDGEIVVMAKHIVVEGGKMHLVERSLRRISHRLPDLGLWFYELATGDEGADWTDEIFRDENAPDKSEVKAKIELTDFSKDMDPAEAARFAEFINSHRERRPKVVGRVVRAIVPLHPMGGFGFTP